MSEDNETRQKFEFVDRGPKVPLTATEASAVAEIMAAADPGDPWETVWLQHEKGTGKPGREVQVHSGTGQKRFREGPGAEWVTPADGHAPWVAAEHKAAAARKGG